MSHEPNPDPALRAPSQIRGAAVATTIDWIRQTYGDDLYQRAVARLSPEDRQGLERRILNRGWYPVLLWDRFLTACAAEVKRKTGEDQETFDIRNIREGGGRILQTVYKFVFSLFKTTTTLQRMAFIFSRIYDQGKAE